MKAHRIAFLLILVYVIKKSVYNDKVGHNYAVNQALLYTSVSQL